MSVTASSLHATASTSSPIDREVRRVFDLQKATALRLRTSTASERIGKLKRLRAAIMARAEEIREAGAKDFRRSAIEVDLTELMPVVLDIGDTCKHLRRWLKPKAVRATSMMLGTRAEVRYEPRGRCLIIAPWNYPLTLTFGPLIPAIASGNTVIIKTSEVAPHFSAVMVRIIRDVFSEDEVAIFEGDASVATALLALPFDHSFFTGAPAIGKLVMSAAAKHLTSVTLELGGKSPTIIDASADLDLAVRAIAWAKMINSGQTCIAPDHIHVHASVRDQVVALFRKHLDQWYGEGMAARDAAFTRIINERHTVRVAGLVSDAQARGAKLLYGGAVDEQAHFVSPTLLTDIPSDARIMDEEIFGPVLPIIPFTDVDALIASINAAPKPLALYIWSKDATTTERIISQTSSGATCVNHVGVHFLHHGLPFGGVNNSGIGSYHGEWGIRAFSHERAVLRTRFMLARMFFPPYTARTRKIVDLILRRF